jgi:hypothetical protein
MLLAVLANVISGLLSDRMSDWSGEADVALFGDQVGK